MAEPDDLKPWARTIHVGVPAEATAAEREVLEDRVVAAVYDMERGQWDALVSSHTGECETDPHCCGPSPRNFEALAKALPAEVMQAELARRAEAARPVPKTPEEKREFSQAWDRRYAESQARKTGGT